MSSLYELTSDWLQLMDMLENQEADEDVIRDTLEGIEGEIEDKMQNCVFCIRNLENLKAGFKREKERMAHGEESCDNRIKSLKKYMQQCMELTGLEKIKTKLSSIWIQNNQPSVVVDAENVDDIPIEYLVVQEPKVDKKKIAEDIKAGVDLYGIAHLEYSRSLRIK